MPNVGTEIRQIITAKMASAIPLDVSEPFVELGFNSFEVVELIFDIEEKFDIQIPFNANFDIEAKTVADLILTVEGLVADKAKLA